MKDLQQMGLTVDLTTYLTCKMLILIIFQVILCWGLFTYVSLSFLVDTGAGVSLLCGDIWEKAVPRGSACDYQGACRLVGVDGIPIKVHGAASVDMVKGHTLSHQFIIADHITAEGILGMDFLEQNKYI